NGDMKTNIELIGILYGIIVLSVLGQAIVRSGSRRSRGSGKKGGGLVLYGIALWAIGSIGSFFARVNKSAISRQREFLADASAVQFTRNPVGIGGALKKILVGDSHSVITHERAEEISHMFFADFSSGYFARMLSTHPPLKERIKRLGVDL